MPEARLLCVGDMHLGRRPSRLPLGAPDTNIVFAAFAGRPASELVAALERNQVRAIATGPATIRFVTHHDVGDEGVDAALAALEGALAA